MSLAVRNALTAARRAFTRKHPKTVSSRRLDDLVGSLHLLQPGSQNLTMDQKLAYWKGFARLVEADPDPKKARFIAVVRQYVGTLNDRWLIMALGEIEYLPETLLASAFGPGANWRQDIPMIIAERLVDEDKWNFLLSKVNKSLRKELIYARGSNRTARNRYNLMRTSNPNVAGPSAPNLPPGFTHAALGFVAGDVRNAAAKKGWMGAGLLGWGDVDAPVTRTIATQFPADAPTGAGLPRAVEGWVTLGHPPRGPQAFDVQRDAVRNFLRDHPHHNRYFDPEREISMEYNFDEGRYIDPNAPPDLDFSNPDHDIYWSYPDWNGSHLCPHSFGFDTTPQNVIPLAGRINKSHMAAYEEMIRDFYARFDGKVYMRTEVLEYDAHGLAKVVRYEAYTPDENNIPIRVLSEEFVTNYHPGVTKAEYMRDAEKAWRIHEEWIAAGEPD